MRLKNKNMGEVMMNRILMELLRTKMPLGFSWLAPNPMLPLRSKVVFNLTTVLHGILAAPEKITLVVCY